MSDLPDREEARSILEDHNDTLIRKHLREDPETLSEKEYDEALGQALQKQAEFAPGTFQDHDGKAHAYFVEAIFTGELSFATLEDTSETLVYQDGSYQANGEAVIRGWVEDRHLQETGASPHHHLVNEVVQAVKRRTYVSRKIFNPPGKLCLVNGVLDVETLRLSPHSPDVRFTLQLPVAYDSEATCPRFLRFLEEVLPEQEARETVQMLGGYLLMPGNWLQVAFMFEGAGNNGKSTLIGVLAALLGHDGVSSETLQSLSMNRFAAASLWGKLANICADIPSTPTRDTGVFKMAMGGDPMRGEKKFQGAFTFVNEAKLIFSCNELPQINDRTYAFWRRWVILPFTEDFTGREDRDLSEKLRKELSGILIWAIKGLELLRRRGQFSKGKSAEALMEEWRRRADSLYWFVQECVERGPNEWVAKADFYESYATFCEEHDLTKKKPEAVGKELPQHVPQVRGQRMRIGGKQVRGWGGLSLRAGESGESGESYRSHARVSQVSQVSQVPLPKERQLARVLKRNVPGTCEFCKRQGEDLLLVGPRGSNDMRKACGTCADARFDFGEPP